jgi:hypothetical protein
MLIEDRTKPQGPTAGPWGKRFMTMAEFAVLMKCTVVTVNRWIKEGQLRVLHVISEDEVKRWTENEESRQAAERIAEDDRYVEFIQAPRIQEPRHLTPPSDRADIEFVLGEIRIKCAHLEAENRRLIDQNLRFRSTLREELLLWEDILKYGRQLKFGAAKRHVSRLLGAVGYDGRSEDPIDQRELGGDLRNEFLAVGAPKPEQLTQPKLVDAGPKPGVKPDKWKVDRIIGENRRI